MKFKNKCLIYFLKDLLIIFFITCAFLGSSILFLSIYLSLRPATYIRNKRIEGEDRLLKQIAIEKNYIPVYFPDTTWNKLNDFSFYPIGSLPLRKSFYCNEGYGLIKYKTDRFGLRNLDKKWSNVNKKNNIFLIGDSFIHGACVKDNDSIAGNLEASLNKQVINLATASNGPYEYLAILKSLMDPIIKKSNKTNYVILFFFTNDDLPFNSNKDVAIKNIKPIVDINSQEIKPNTSYIKSIKYLIEENYPIKKEEIKVAVNKHADKSRLNYQILTAVRLRKRILKKLTNSNNSKQLKNNYSPSDKVIDYLAEICTDKCRPIIAYIPGSKFYETIPKNDNYQKRIKSLSKKYNIPFIDGSKVINSETRSDWAPKGTHFSIEGYRKFSNLIVEHFRKNY